LIRLCTIECSYIQPLDGEQNQKFAADIEGWSKLAKHLFIWDYTTNYNDYLGPHPNLRVLAPNVRYFVKHGAVGLFEEGEGDDFCELKNWLLMRLMWEPHLDGDQLIDEFVRGYYGEAVAPLIKRYWDILIVRAEEGRHLLGLLRHELGKMDRSGDAQPGHRDHEQGDRDGDRSLRPDSDELRRLQKSKMGIDHVWLSRYYPLRCEAREQKLPFLGPKDPIKAAEEFAQALQRFKTKAAAISQEELRAIPGRLEGRIRWRRRIRRRSARVSRKMPGSSSTPLSFNNYRATQPPSSTIRKAGTARAFAWERRSTGIPTTPRRSAGSTACSPRCAVKEPIKEGKLGSWGVYDAQGKKSLKSMLLKPKDFATEDGNFDKEFRWIDLGVIDFVPGAYFWFAHGHDPELEAIFVDRVVLIRAE
jgi:hypothetical protein